MKKVLSLCVLGLIVTTLALSGCEKKSDTEKALEGMKKDAESMVK